MTSGTQSCQKSVTLPWHFDASRGTAPKANLEKPQRMSDASHQKTAAAGCHAAAAVELARIVLVRSFPRAPGFLVSERNLNGMVPPALPAFYLDAETSPFIRAFPNLPLGQIS